MAINEKEKKYAYFLFEHQPHGISSFCDGNGASGRLRSQLSERYCFEYAHIDEKSSK
ncbi:hypothetical protein JMY81_10040 [Brenneria goodwinii]|uniref:hypothetical protein n=1 Tax=Brenneria goodwinii TaxID=1109412 RepID=UPI0012E1A39B|nr:hypothetical protein [Brenneria goodwinii]MCG8158369.1 hypothetical protein [Brenneria goodwinii]MCG8161181.1 hypothetical protein [Brenneria goodwinii]MCG8165401.1 hypothetical protein [Brenneria goodwinii]MCG8169884.1 hypothetical protein [Brenneria goodwinii]MCG8177145.1 hypothetical protein [Brenneria goodwinii]